MNLQEIREKEYQKRIDDTRYDFTVECMREALNGAIEHLKEQHPYPKGVFDPVNKEDWEVIIKSLHKAGYNETRIFGDLLRIGYESAIAKLDEIE